MWIRFYSGRRVGGWPTLLIVYTNAVGAARAIRCCQHRAHASKIANRDKAAQGPLTCELARVRFAQDYSF